MLGPKMPSTTVILAALFKLSTAVLVSEDALNNNCFLLLAEPLAAPPFPEDGIARMRKHFLANLNIDGTGHVISARGDVPAQHNCCPGGYGFDWVREGALSISILQDLLGSDIATMGSEAYVTDAVVTEIVTAYAGWVEKLQNLKKDASAPPIDVFGEPKWDIKTGRPYQDIWCRPQTDGPGLRAKALMMFSSGGLAKESEDSLTQKLWELIKFDLDWLAAGEAFNMSTCDLWEETRGHDFLWNRLTMRQALLMGEPMALAMGDKRRAEAYRASAHNLMKNPLQSHLKAVGDNVFITECSTTEPGDGCRNYGKDIDGGVILALIHSGWEKSFGELPSMIKPVDVVVAETVQAFNLGFCSIFPINKQDTSVGVPGVLYGRYALDKYGGGNPWHITTASLATLFYQAAQVVARGTVLSMEQLLAWRAALNSQHFRGTAKEFVAAGDSVLARLRHHMHKDENWHVFEQMDKYSGKQYNAEDFTWSYAEVFASLAARADATNLIIHPVVLHGPGFARPGSDQTGRSSCFLMLDRPRPSTAMLFKPDTIANMRKNFMANLNVNGMGATMASPGLISPLVKSGGDYKYDFVQDGALSMMALYHLSNSYIGYVGEGSQISDYTAQSVMSAYVEWVRRIQRTIKISDKPAEAVGRSLLVRDSVHGEPRWDVATALPIVSEHCSLQTSVPSLRAQALMLIGNEAGLAVGDIWDLIKFDLDWLVNASDRETHTCDLWGETMGNQFMWNDVTMVFALMEGHRWALNFGDTKRAKMYQATAKDKIGDASAGHLLMDATTGGIVLSDCLVEGEDSQESPCHQSGKGVSTAVIFALIHGNRWNWKGDAGIDVHDRVMATGSPLITPTAAVVARTVQKLNKEFCTRFDVNTQDTEAGVPGILYGRYATDAFLGGNPWLSSTAALASLFYQASSFISAGNLLDPEELLAWRGALGESFSGEAEDFLAAGDSVLLRLRHHIGDSSHLYEELDRRTGRQFNAEDMTWSYVEVLMANTERMAALEHAGRFSWTKPDPLWILKALGWCLFSLLVSGCIGSIIWFRLYRKTEEWRQLLPIDTSPKLTPRDNVSPRSRREAHKEPASQASHKVLPSDGKNISREQSRTSVSASELLAETTHSRDIVAHNTLQIPSLHGDGSLSARVGALKDKVGQKAKEQKK